MKIGIYNFPTDYSMRIDELAVEAEQRGYESIWVTEHTHIPVSRKTPWPGGADLPREYWHTHDPFVALSFAAAATRTIKLGTGICLLIERDTLTTAKTVASLDLLSGGRVLFGVGGGWNREEMENHGTDYDTRFQRLEEQIDALRRIWTEDEPEFHGDHVDFDPVWSYPKPLQDPHPPIILGGGTRYTRQRVVDHGDGWLPIEISAAAVRKGVEDLWRRAEEAGRDRGTISVTVFGAEPTRENLDAYEAVGVERVLLRMPSEGRDDLLRRLDRWQHLIEV